MLGVRRRLGKRKAPLSTCAFYEGSLKAHAVAQETRMGNHDAIIDTESENGSRGQQNSYLVG